MALMMTLTAFPQSGESKQLTKFEEFSSKTGSIIKFVDFSLPKLSLSWGGAWDQYSYYEGKSGFLFL